MTYYLKFPNENAATQLLEEAGFLDEDNIFVAEGI